MQTREYKTIFAGPSKIGKTTFLHKLFYNNNDIYNLRTIPSTLGVTVMPVDFYNENDKIRLDIWDCAGDRRYKGLGKQYYINSNLAIVFKDKTSFHRNIINDINEICGNIPILEINNFDKYKNYEVYKNLITNFLIEQNLL
tara:strand:+ start:315 stop:737 length:423 start_codon:yes stop_codon:yes gene_type:complete